MKNQVKSYPEYTVYYRYVDPTDKLRHWHIRIKASSADAAKASVIRSLKPTMVAVDKVKREKGLKY